MALSSRLISKIAVFLILITSHQCSKKPAGVFDPTWQEESLRIAGEICSKILECTQSSQSLKNLEKSKAEFTEKRLQEASCQEHHRKTNVFQLIGEDPETIKKATRECHKEMIAYSCEELIQKKYLETPACVQMGKIQKGK